MAREFSSGPPELAVLRSSLLASPLLAEAHLFVAAKTSGSLSRDRFIALIEENASIDHEDLEVESVLCVRYGPDEGKQRSHFAVRFRAAGGLELPDGLDGCVACGGARADGLPTCAEHADGIAERPDGIAEHADGIAERPDGIAEHADGIAEHADGIAGRPDGIAEHVKTREDQVASASRELCERMAELMFVEVPEFVSAMFDEGGKFRNFKMMRRGLDVSADDE